MQPTPINAAEAILDPLWDARLSGLKHWAIDPGDAHGLVVSQNWCWAAFEWTRRPASGPALRMTRRFDAPCEEYDRLLVSIMAPPGSVCRITVTHDKGDSHYTSEPAGQYKREHAVVLGGAKKLDTVTIELDAADSPENSPAAGWINWVGLRDTPTLKRLQHQRQRFDEAWEPYLLPESHEPSFEPKVGLLINKEELADLRRRHEQAVREHGRSPIDDLADMVRHLTPETMVRDFVNFWGDTRYCRERDHGNVLVGTALTGHATNAAIAGLVLRDKHLLRLSARLAMAITLCDRWDDGMICALPGGTFDHRCFVQSLCLHETAMTLDLAGEWFTDTGRLAVMRRMALEGLAAVHFNTWAYEYIFHCNQMAWFSPGRMAACAVLEKTWPRVKPYTDIAMSDLIETLGLSVLSDGGYVEGPTYFTCVGSMAGRALDLFARARGSTLAQVMPETVKRSADFGAAVRSTDDTQDVIPICDAGKLMGDETLAVMASSLPKSEWVAMFHKSIARNRGFPANLLAWRLRPTIPAESPAPKPFIFMPEMGLMTSTRRLGEHWTKILLMGNKAGAGHTHEDKGSFVLEFAGETFACDPGTCDYGNPLAGQLHNADRHSMLVPTGTIARPHPACPLPVDVKPKGKGDATAFHATLDATPGWEGYYRRWTRAWDSPTPDVLTITDDYELDPSCKANSVEFYWQTMLPVAVRGSEVVITGKGGEAIITPPQGSTVRVDELPLLGGAKQYRVAFVRKKPAGRIVTQVRLRPTPSPSGRGQG
ncbi:MAG: heparinase II/III-family protein [Planctomycetes bacterium]|nr:heparinase II/III-family protein [Planctomycetota bacterium]